MMYDLARALDARHDPGATKAFEAFLATQHGAADDPLVVDARSRIR